MSDFDQIESELEMLKEIYWNELETIEEQNNGGKLLRLTMHPSTAEDVDRQYVQLRLMITVSSKYPDEIPLFTVMNYRGLADEHIQQLLVELRQLSLEKTGNCMLYDLLLHVQDSLTEWNTPHALCPVCLEDFSVARSFCKTQCFHYLHTHCLQKYVLHSLQEIDRRTEEWRRYDRHTLAGKLDDQVVCPVCRVSLPYDPDSLVGGHLSEVCETVLPFVPTEDLRQWQEWMKTRLMEQVLRGQTPGEGHTGLPSESLDVQVTDPCLHEFSHNEADLTAVGMSSGTNTTSVSSSSGTFTRAVQPETNVSSSDKVTRAFQPATNISSSSDKFTRAVQPEMKISSSSDKFTRAFQPETNISSSSDKFTRAFQPETNISSSSDKVTRVAQPETNTQPSCVHTSDSIDHVKDLVNGVGQGQQLAVDQSAGTVEVCVDSADRQGEETTGKHSCERVDSGTINSGKTNGCVNTADKELVLGATAAGKDVISRSGAAHKGQGIVGEDSATRKHNSATVRGQRGRDTHDDRRSGYRQRRDRGAQGSRGWGEYYRQGNPGRGGGRDGDLNRGTSRGGDLDRATCRGVDLDKGTGRVGDLDKWTGRGGDLGRGAGRGGDLDRGTGKDSNLDKGTGRGHDPVEGRVREKYPRRQGAHTEHPQGTERNRAGQDRPTIDQHRPNVDKDRPTVDKDRPTTDKGRLDRIGHDRPSTGPDRSSSGKDRPNTDQCVDGNENLTVEDQRSERTFGKRRHRYRNRKNNQTANQVDWGVEPRQNEPITRDQTANQLDWGAELRQNEPITRDQTANRLDWGAEPRQNEPIARDQDRKKVEDRDREKVEFRDREKVGDRFRDKRTYGYQPRWKDKGGQNTTRDGQNGKSRDGQRWKEISGCEDKSLTQLGNDLQRPALTDPETIGENQSEVTQFSGQTKNRSINSAGHRDHGYKTSANDRYQNDGQNGGSQGQSNTDGRVNSALSASHRRRNEIVNHRRQEYRVSVSDNTSSRDDGGHRGEEGGVENRKTHEEKNKEMTNRKASQTWYRRTKENTTTNSGEKTMHDNNDKTAKQYSRANCREEDKYSMRTRREEDKGAKQKERRDGNDQMPLVECRNETLQSKYKDERAQPGLGEGKTQPKQIEGRSQESHRVVQTGDSEDKSSQSGRFRHAQRGTWVMHNTHRRKTSHGQEPANEKTEE